MAITMTPELRAKLSGMLPLYNDAKAEYTPEAFKDIPELNPVFYLKQFNNGQVRRIKELMSYESQGKKKGTNNKGASDKEYFELLHSVLVGWDGYVELSTGEDFLYDGTMETMLKLPEWLLVDLYAEAVKITGFLPVGAL